MAATLEAAQDVRHIARLTALEVLGAMEAASVSVSRWEREEDRLRTLVNVGDLAPGEDPEPVDEVYPVADYAFLADLLHHGRPCLTAVDDAETDPHSRALLARVGKTSGISLAIRVDGLIWGELYVTLAEDRRPDMKEACALQPLADQLGLVIARAERLGRMTDLAFRDPLTGLANRRALDEGLPRMLAAARRAGSPVAVLLADLDNLKALNDAAGHGAGDAALRRAAQALLSQTTVADALVARTGGDEFCLVLHDADAERAKAIGDALIAELAEGEPALGMSCGVASATDAENVDAVALLRAADTALYAAKRSGRGRTCMSGSEPFAAWTATAPRVRVDRRLRRRGGVDVERLLADGLAVLDGLPAAASPMDRLVAITDTIAMRVEAAAAGVSTHDLGAQTVRTAYALDRRSGHSARVDGGGIDDAPFDLRRYPVTVRLLAEGATLVLSVDDEDIDPQESELLEAFGFESVLMIAPIANGPWLVEIFGDGAGPELHPSANAARLLVAEAVRAGDRP